MTNYEFRINILIVRANGVRPYDYRIPSSNALLNVGENNVLPQQNPRQDKFILSGALRIFKNWFLISRKLL